MEQKSKNKTKIIIIVLAVLLSLSLVALAGTLIYNKFSENKATTVTVPDNLITPDEENDNNTETNENNSADETQSSSATNSTENVSANINGTNNQNYATEIKLYSKQPQDNTAFYAGNMLPGDSEIKYYRVQVSYHDKLTVHFGVDIRKGYEKLAEVMNVKVKLLTTGETLYDGLMKDLPENIAHKLNSSKSTTDELYYEITAYLETSVGNEYQNKDLIADFKWWVEETGNLDNAPQTGDNFTLFLWLIIFCTSLLLCFACIPKKRRNK